MNIIKLNGKSYYNSVSVKKEHPKLFRKCIKIRYIIDMQDLEKNDYCYAYIKEEKWIVSTKSYNKAKLLLTKQCVERLLAKEEKKNDDLDDSSDDESDEEEEILQAPDILELEDEEKFVDAKGRILEIETRGERHPEKCYFSVYDISKQFKIPRLQNTIIDKRTTYKITIDYKYFIVNDKIHHKQNDKQIFLTYRGLLKLSLTSKSDYVFYFINQVVMSSFTFRMGTDEQKKMLIDKLGATVDSIDSVAKRSVNNISCVYLFIIGSVKNLRLSMSIDNEHNDDLYVCKSGMTNNLKRRTREHKNKYGIIKGSNLCLKYYCYVDPKYVSKAETHMNQFYKNKNMLLEYKKEKELIVVDKKTLDTVIKNELDIISEQYSGIVSNINDRVIQQEHMHSMMIKDFELKETVFKKDLDIMKKDLEIRDITIMSLKKELELIKKYGVRDED